jgi:hypothetical protein
MNAWNDIPPDDRERIRKPLAALEETFRPMAESLRFDDEPAAIFHPAEDEE